ncbi:hypothetical protein GFM13_19330 [Rhizobium leguminosarum bv. viciae]|nr:hypothetical protein [Rhizobium leguminosarum bv. viciae]
MPIAAGARPPYEPPFARYRMRGDAGVRAGQWERFKVMLMSPRNYYEQLAAKHSSHIDAILPCEQLVEALGPLLEPDMMVHPTKSMAFVNIRTPAINHSLNFEVIRADVISSLGTLERLRRFAMDEQVRKLVTATL